MKTIAMRLLALITMMGICVAASAADTTVSEVWTCSINDGKTMDDVRAANSNWLKFMNANVEGGGISSNIVTSVVGNAERGHFMYVDSFPTLESWAEAGPLCRWVPASPADAPPATPTKVARPEPFLP
jgi:hypothetical protein